MKSRIIWRALCLGALLLFGGTSLSAGSYDLMIDGKSVNDTNKDDILGNGAFSYNPATKTLSVKKNYTATDDGTLIWSKIEGLTVRVCADVTLTTTFENRKVCNFYASTTFTGWGELTMRSKSGTVYTYGDLIFDNIRVNAFGGYFCLCGTNTSENKSKLIIRKSTLSVSGDYSAVQNFGGGITLEQCEVVSPEGAYAYFGSFMVGDDRVKDLRIQAIQPEGPWPLKIAGTAVTNSNCNDILGDGRFRFDTTTKTLWVKDDYTSSSTYPIIDNEGVSHLLICNEKPITLTATKAAVFKCAAPTVFSNCDFTMTAPSRIAQCGADVTFDHAAITLTGGNYGLFAANGTERLYVDMSDISISAKTAAVFGFEGGVALERSRIVLPEEGVVQDGSFCDKDGNVAKNLEIKAEYLSIRQQEHCQVTATPSYPQPGETVMLTATLLDNHYFLQSFKVTDSDGNAVPLTGGTWDDPTATFVMPEGEVTVEPVVTDDASKLYVCVPKTGSRTIQIDPHWNLTGLKIYDDGGPGVDYSANCDGTLTFVAPEGYVLQLEGISEMEGEYESAWLDYITIHDGATTSAPYLGRQHYGTWNGDEVPVCESSGRAITIHAVSDGGYQIGGFILTLTMVRRELLVGGILVTDENKNDILGNGIFSFDPGSYTLHVKGSYSGIVPVVQNLGYDQLTISVDQDATLTTTRFTDALLLRSPTTITGRGLLTLQSDDVACESFADLTFDHASVAVKGNGFGLAGDPNGTTKLIVKDSYLHLDMEAAIAVKDFYGGIELEGCELLLPEEGYISGGTIWFKDVNDNPMEVIIGQPIQLSIAGTAVTMQNCSDVLGNGLFSYNPGTKTLTVKGSYSTGDDWMITNGMEGVTINVPADATLEVTDEGTGVLGCYAATTFTGKGRLTMKAPAGAEEVIYVGNDVTLGLDHADIVVKGAKVGLNTLGDMSTAALDIVHSNLQAEGTQAAAGRFGGGISLTECELFFPSPGDYTNSRFLDKNGNDAKAVIVTYDIATGITERPATSSTKEPAYYDLSGRRIQRPQKGMYIVRDRGDRSKVLLMK